MRREISIVIASILFLFVVYLAISGYIIMSDFWTGLSIALIPIALAILFWGFKPQIYGFFKKNGKTEGVKIEAEPVTEVVRTEIKPIKKKSRSKLLPDSTKITKLNIEKDLLDQIYEEAKKKAIEVYSDAKFTEFTIQVIPFDSLPSVNIYMDFYSKRTNKVCHFHYSGIHNKLQLIKPFKRPINVERTRPLKNLPWKKYPNWKEFVRVAYEYVKPLPQVEGTQYILWHYSKLWKIVFEDGEKGDCHPLEWDGKGIGEKNIRRLPTR